MPLCVGRSMKMCKVGVYVDLISFFMELGTI